MPTPVLPLEIVPPVHYLGILVDSSEAAITGLTLNLTVIPETTVSDTPEQRQEIDVTTIFITYTDGRDIYTLGPGDYSIVGWQSGDGDDALEPSEVAELILPLRQPVPTNTNVCVELWIPYHGTLDLEFRTPDTIKPAGQAIEFTVAPFVPD